MPTRHGTSACAIKAVMRWVFFSRLLDITSGFLKRSMDYRGHGQRQLQLQSQERNQKKETTEKRASKRKTGNERDREVVNLGWGQRETKRRANVCDTKQKQDQKEQSPRKQLERPPMKHKTTVHLTNPLFSRRNLRLKIPPMLIYLSDVLFCSSRSILWSLDRAVDSRDIVVTSLDTMTIR